MRWVRVVAAVAAVVAVVAVVYVVGVPGLAEIQSTVQAAGIWAPLLFLALQVAMTVAPVPRTVFTVAAGVLFGAVTGLLLAVVGTALAAVAAFWLVRMLGAGFVERHADRAAVAWVQARLDRRGLLAVVSLRLIPALPFSVLNYAAGLSGIRFAPYLLGTVLGTLPGTVAIVVLGDAVTDGTPDPALLAVSVVSGLVGLTGAAVVARRERPGTAA